MFEHPRRSRRQLQGTRPCRKARSNNAVPKAVAGIRALRERLAEESPAYGAAVQFERDAETFSKRSGASCAGVAS